MCPDVGNPENEIRNGSLILDRMSENSKLPCDVRQVEFSLLQILITAGLVVIVRPDNAPSVSRVRHAVHAESQGRRDILSKMNARSFLPARPLFPLWQGARTRVIIVNIVVDDLGRIHVLSFEARRIRAR